MVCFNNYFFTIFVFMFNKIILKKSTDVESEEFLHLDVLKLTWGSIPNGKWQNYQTLKIRIKVDQKTKEFLKSQIKTNVDKQPFNFIASKKDGLWSCESDLKGIQGLSKFPDRSEICHLNIILWSQNKLNKSEQRDLLIHGILND